MAKTREQKAASQARRRARLAALKAAAEAASKPEPKEVRRAINGRDALLSLERRVDANSHHFFFLAQRIEAQGILAGEQRALLGQLADQNALLRDQLAGATWRVEQLEARIGAIRAALSDDAPLLVSVDEWADEVAARMSGTNG